MHIKRVIIEGLKSFKRRVIFDSFDSGINVIVGKNGAGKSNFFLAIQVLLSDDYARLKATERLVLLHDGAGPKVISAYVEIVFDNGDKRIPVDSLEVSLRRVIGSKRDQYFLNRRSIPRSSFVSLLDSAGLPTKNPYFIVKQGKIGEIAESTAANKLELIKEVAGVREFHGMRQNSIDVFVESTEKLEKIKLSLRTKEKDLETLMKEQESLKEYEELEQVHRVVEYIIHDNELRGSKERLQEIEHTRELIGKKQKYYVDIIAQAQEKAQDLSMKIDEMCKSISTAKEEADILSSEQQTLLKQIADLELAIEDTTKAIQCENGSKKIKEELENIEAIIAEKERELEELKPQCKEQKTREEECKKQLALKQQERQEILAMQSRGRQFTSEAERNLWIRNELESLAAHIENKKKYRSTLRASLKRDTAKLAELEKKLSVMKKELEAERVAITNCDKQYTALKEENNQKHMTRNELWRRETILTNRLTQVKEQLFVEDQKLTSISGKATLNGIESVRKVLEIFRERGGEWAETSAQYYGPVIENFACDEIMYTAVEVTSGKKLFYHIVESDDIGTKILKEMNRLQLHGEVTFMPLNRLRVRDTTYPNNANVIPMLRKLKFEADYLQAMKYVFGKILICRNMENAVYWGKEFGMDCVTIDGDLSDERSAVSRRSLDNKELGGTAVLMGKRDTYYQVLSKGVLNGGFINQSRSLLGVRKKKSDLLKILTSIETEMETLKHEINNTDTSINSIVSEMERLTIVRERAKDICERIKAEMSLVKEEITQIENSRVSLEDSLSECLLNIEVMLAAKATYELELYQKLTDHQSTEDEARVEELNETIRALSEELASTSNARMSLEAVKNKLENLLNNNLIRRRDELMQSLLKITEEDLMNRLSNERMELSNAECRLQQVEKELEEARAKETNAVQNKMSFEKERCDWRNKENIVQDKKDEGVKMSQVIENKESAVRAKMQECVEHIATMKPLPNAPELLTMYQKMSQSQLNKLLNEVNDRLKRFSHVNMKAVEQVKTLREQIDHIKKKFNELTENAEQLQHMIDTLDQKKWEAIDYTFDQVRGHFVDVFKKIEPRGRASISMYDERTSADTESGEQEATARKTNRPGVYVRVSFTGGDDEGQDISQLSGGQKTIVAFALLFALQKCDPAPFYLFDEMDQALDTEYREAVAKLIFEMSATAQFIVTTFRPEILEYAKKYYGIKFKDTVSEIMCITKEEAMQFVDDS